MQQQSAQSIRKRARKACESCRKRKRRCDGAQPCRACIEYEYECYYTDQPSSTTIGEPSRSSSLPSRIAESASSKDYDAEVLPHGGSVAFPQAVAHAVYGQCIPTHQRNSFGYNVGVPAFTSTSGSSTERLVTAVSLETALVFCQRYCETCGLAFPVIDNDTLLEGLRKLWLSASSHTQTSPTELAITFTILMGSYFSWPRLVQSHDALLLHAQQELDRLTFRQVSKEHDWLLRAWVLKTLLLRMTGAPNLVWLSSCNMMHVAELIEGNPQQGVAFLIERRSSDSEETRTLLALAWTINQMISLESGRSVTQYPTVVPFVDNDPNRTECLSLLQSTFQRMQKLDIHRSTAAAKACLLELCHRRIASASHLDVRTLLIEACVICGIYRQIFQKGGCFETEAMPTIRTVLEDALTAAENLAETKEPWFMLAGYPSQLICICLALGRPLLNLLPRVLALLATVTKAFGSEALREAGETVTLLIKACLKSRDEETLIVRRSLHYLPQTSNRSSIEEEEVWTQFLNQQVFEEGSPRYPTGG